MLTVLSPAKSLDFSAAPIAPTEPRWQADAIRLAKTARNLPLRDLRALMSLSDDLARLNRDRFRAFQNAPKADAVRPAAFAFNGDTYQGFRARDLSPDDIAWAQDHMRILSGLYGLLRPLDAIQPYRLEMGARLKTRRGTNLYAYWGDAIANALRSEAAAMNTDTLLNCASDEYFRAADRKTLGLRVITPVFKEIKGNEAKMVSFFAKRARGAMARFVTLNRIADPVHLRDFDLGGYAFDAAQSTDTRLAFTRPYPDSPTPALT